MSFKPGDRVRLRDRPFSTERGVISKIEKSAFGSKVKIILKKPIGGKTVWTPSDLEHISDYVPASDSKTKESKINEQAFIVSALLTRRDSPTALVSRSGIVFGVNEDEVRGRLIQEYLNDGYSVTTFTLSQLNKDIIDRIKKL